MQILIIFAALIMFIAPMAQAQTSQKTTMSTGPSNLSSLTVTTTTGKLRPDLRLQLRKSTGPWSGPSALIVECKNNKTRAYLQFLRHVPHSATVAVGWPNDPTALPLASEGRRVEIAKAIAFLRHVSQEDTMTITADSPDGPAKTAFDIDPFTKTGLRELAKTCEWDHLLQN